MGYLERFILAERILTLTELAPERVQRYAAAFKNLGKSARTIQAIIGAVKSFSSSLLKDGKLPRDPLASVEKPDPDSDRRKLRRMLLPEEWPHLDAATANGPIRHGMPGAERALLYRLAIQTGLRAGELRSLTSASLVLGPTPAVRVTANDTKNGKSAQQFIDQELAELLRQHAARKSPAAPLFAMPDRTKLAPMLRDDLAMAREAWLHEVNADAELRCEREQRDFLKAKNDAGESIDFHSLRHTTASWLAMSGAGPK